jgi:transposase-like protein
MDAIHYKVRDSGQIVNRAAYVVIGVNIEGYKDVLGIWVGANESAKYCLGILNEFKTEVLRIYFFFA